jgi:hypothetical protein
MEQAGDRPMSDKHGQDRRVHGPPTRGPEGGEMQGSWRLLKLWTAPVRNLTWVNAHFGHR